MKLRVINLSTDLCEDECHATYQNDEQDGVRYDEFDVWDLLSPEEQAARRDPDQYIRIVDKYKEEKVWKAIARFERGSLINVPAESSLRPDIATCVRWSARQKLWKVAVEHNGHKINFLHQVTQGDALAFAIEAIRCLRPDAVLSDAERAHHPVVATRHAVAVLVAQTIAARLRPEEISPRVRAVLLLLRFHFAGGQFEQNRDGVWQLWQEVGDDINPQLVARAKEIEHEIAEILTTTWMFHHSVKIDPERYALNIPQQA